MLRNCFWHSYFMIKKNNNEVSDLPSEIPSKNQHPERTVNIFVLFKNLFKKIYSAIYV